VRKGKRRDFADRAAGTDPDEARASVTLFVERHNQRTVERRREK